MGSCTSATSESSTTVNSQTGVAGNITEVDEIAMAAIKGGIGEQKSSALKKNVIVTLSLEGLEKQHDNCFIVLHEVSKQSGMKQMKGRTETISNSVEPIFVKSFELEFLFEEQQTIRAEIYNEVDKARTTRE